MNIKNIFSWIFLFSASAMLAIGRVYDERLDLLGIKFSIILSVVYVMSSCILLLSIKKITTGKSKNLLLVFYLYIIVITPILWTIYEYIEYGFYKTTYEYMEYGVLKYLNFILIVIPISIIISEKFNYRNVSYFFKILLVLTSSLAILGIFGLFSDVTGRLSVLGGGPIVFARWMSLAVLILIFFPQMKWNTLRYFLAILFILLALASGSRGPLFSLFFSVFIFFFMNFRRTFYKVILFLMLFIASIMFTSVGEKVIKLGSIDRVLMNITQGGSGKSTGARVDFMQRSLTLLIEKPFGVGCGNWQVEANKNNSKHMIAHAYPHNVLFEVINEYGIIAGVIFFLLLWHIFYLSYSKMILYHKNKSSFYPLLFYSFIYLLINSMLSGDLGDARMLFIIIALIVIHKPLILSANAN